MMVHDRIRKGKMTAEDLLYLRRRLPRIAERARQLVALQPGEIPLDGVVRVGLRADAVAHMPGRSEKDKVKPAAFRNDGTARWYFKDMTIVFHYQNGHWFVKELEPPVEVKASKRARKRRRKR